MQKRGYIIAFKLKKGVVGTKRTEFFRGLYGYTEHSQYSKYLYIRESNLGKDVKFFSPVRAVIVTRKEDKERILKFMQGKAEIFIREISLTSQDIKKLYGLKKQ